MATTDDRDKELDTDEWHYETTPRYVRFRLDLADGERYLTLDKELWENLDRDFHQVVHNARRITEQDLPNFMQRIQGMRSWGLPQVGDKPPAMLVNIAKHADGSGFILRVYEARQDREWNIQTWGEFDALERAVAGRG